MMRLLPLRHLRVFTTQRNLNPQKNITPTLFAGAGLTSRSFSSGADKNSDCSFTDKGELIEIGYGGSKTTLSYMWLRDHCRSDRYYNHTTKQRRHDRFDFPLDIRPKNINLEQKQLTVKWEDDHVSTYDVEWLLRNSYPEGHKSKVKKVLWNKEIMKDIASPVVKCDDYMNSENGLRKHLENLVKYGFSIVSGVDTTLEATQKVAERLCYMKETLFGPTFSLLTDTARSDIAYTDVAISAHTDTPYYEDTAGIQVLHCLKHDGEGGMNILVDGFQVAEKFRSTHPKEFAFLSTRAIPQEYKEDDPAHHVVCVDRIITLDPVTNDVAKIRFKSYNRAPMSTIPPEEHRMFYESYAKFCKEIYNPSNELTNELKPGNVFFFDNYRSLHARTAFTGKRAVCGCYLPRADWVGKARVMNAT